jgi:hypothetical protein
LATQAGTQKELPPNVETHPGPVAALIDQLRNDKTIKGKVWIVGGSQYAHVRQFAVTVFS